jgi:hypothetical protein
MTTKKEIIMLDANMFGKGILEQYDRIDFQIKQLEEQKDALKAIIHSKLEPVFDPLKTYKTANYTFNARELWECDQQATFEAFKKEANRKLLYPSSILFKPGKDKELAKEMKLLTMTFSNPVIVVKR